jgi:hypothetical protein
LPLNEFLKPHDQILKYLSEISILFFTAGIFSSSLKYLQFLGIFEKEFKKAISSKEFDQKLEKQLKQITFSEDFLIKQSNLPELWETVTLCKYRKQFPDIYPKLKSKVNNELFSNDNISYYYKNFQLSYTLSLEDEIYVRIIEKATLTIVRPNREVFEWDFGVVNMLDKDERITSLLKFNVKNMNGMEFDYNDINEDIKEGFVNRFIKKNLSGKLEYHIEREINSVQNIEKDRVFGFGSSRIIDDISVRIQHSKDLNVYFEAVGGNKYYHNAAFDEDDKAFINRGVFLPGEKFKIFIYRV